MNLGVLKLWVTSSDLFYLDYLEVSAKEGLGPSTSLKLHVAQLYDLLWTDGTSSEATFLHCADSVLCLIRSTQFASNT